MSKRPASYALQLEALARSLRAFLAWWFDELAGLVPTPVRRILRGREASLVFCLLGDVIEVRHVSRDAAKVLGTVDIGAPDAFRALARTLPRSVPQVALRLPAEAALRDVFQLPLGAERELDRVLTFELARRIPLKVEDIHFGHRVRERLSTGRMAVEVTIVPRRVVADALARMAELGVTPDRVEVAVEDPTPPAVLWVADRRTPARRRAASVLGVATAMLAAAAIFVPLEQEHVEAERLGREVAAARATAQRVDQLKAEIERLQADGSFLVDKRRRAPMALDVWNELTRLLPDDTWLTQMQISGDEVHLHGQAASAASLIALLDGSRRFRNPAFRSAVLPDAKSSSERFQISAQVIPERLK